MKNIFNTKVELNETEDNFLQIIESAVKDKENSLEYDIENMNYLIHIPKLQYYIYLDEVGVQLTNHNFFITKHIRAKVLDKYKSIVRKEISLRIQNKKQEIFKNESVLLNKIKEEL